MPSQGGLKVAWESPVWNPCAWTVKPWSWWQLGGLASMQPQRWSPSTPFETRYRCVDKSWHEKMVWCIFLCATVQSFECKCHKIIDLIKKIGVNSPHFRRLVVCLGPWLDKTALTRWETFSSWWASTTLQLFSKTVGGWSASFLMATAVGAAVLRNHGFLYFCFKLIFFWELVDLWSL